MGYKTPLSFKEYKKIHHCKSSHYEDLLDEMRNAESTELIEALEDRFYNIVMQ